MVQASAAAALARLASRASVTPGSCLWYDQDAWQTPHVFPSAIAQWSATVQHTTMTAIPHGAPVFWSGGSHGYGHIALWDHLRQGVLSTDQLTTGHVATVSLNHITSTWGMHLLGWGSTLGGVTLPLGLASAAPPPLPVASRPRVSLTNLRASIIKDGPAAQGYASNRANTLPVEQALYRLGFRGFAVDGSAGSATFGARSAYQQWQIRLGFRGAGADGYPPSVMTGSDSFSRLGAVSGLYTAVA